MEKLQGLLNKVFPNQEVEAEAKRRIFLCLLPDGDSPHCRHYEEREDSKLGPKCGGCGCFLKFKSRSPKSKCPLGKWEEDVKADNK